MAETSTCPKCDSLLPVNAPSGICPKCLMRVGLGDADASGNGDALEPTNVQMGAFVPPVPEELSQYFSQLQILEPLGHGGMGAVYKARQTKLDRLVALKIIRPESVDNQTFTERFNREARTLAHLNHPNIVAIHDFGEVPFSSTDAAESEPRDLYYFVMEYVDGANLRQLMQAGGLPAAQAISIVSQICDALQYAHDEGVVHRDIKPENILIDARGRVKIADFGLAKLASRSDTDFTLTGTHQVMGTLQYMAPEQMEGSRSVDHRADIYSLGVVFYEMLTGEVPMGRFDPPSQKSPVDSRLDQIVLQAMSRDPERRFQRASEITEGLAPFAVSSMSGLAVQTHGAWPGPSTILERGVERLVEGVREGDVAQSVANPAVPGALALLLSLGGLVTLFFPWGEVAIDRSPVYAWEDAPGSAAGFLFLALALTMFAAGTVRRSLWWRPWVVIAVACASLAMMAAFCTQTGGVVHPVTGMLAAAGCCVGLLLIAAWDIRNQLGQRDRESGSATGRRASKETAQVGFTAPDGIEPAPIIVSCFSQRGYRLVEETPDEWLFERAGKSGVWDIRRFRTTVTIRIGPDPQGGHWVSCSWSVRNGGGFLSNGEIAKLEAEGHELASLMGSQSIGDLSSDSPNNADDSETSYDSRTIISIGGGSDHRGVWQVPRRVNVYSLCGGCDLDFRDATFLPGVTTVRVISVMSGVDVTVPPEVRVSVDGMGLLGGFGEAGRLNNTASDADGPMLHVTGFALMAGVGVKTKPRQGTPDPESLQRKINLTGYLMMLLGVPALIAGIIAIAFAMLSLSTSSSLSPAPTMMMAVTGLWLAIPGGLLIAGARSVFHRRSFGWAISAAVVLTIALPPLGIWALWVLSRQPSRAAFAENGGQGSLAGRSAITMTRSELEDDNLPDVCIVCGAATADRVLKTWPFNPDWSQMDNAKETFSSVASMMTGGQAAVASPVCHRHRNHWSHLVWFASTGWLLIVPFAVAGYLMSVEFYPESEGPQAALSVTGGLIGTVLYIAGLVWLGTTRVHGQWSDQHTIHFGRVATAFVQAVRAVRMSNSAGVDSVADAAPTPVPESVDD